MITHKTNTKGFTIIEVVLVLAIAGLIFLVVFLALPALQRGQRDTQRKQDLGRLLSQINSYQANHQGDLPTSWTGFVTSYMTNNGSRFADPSTGTPYEVLQMAAANVPYDFAGNNPAPGRILVSLSAKCGGTGTSSNPGDRNVAVVVRQEQGGYYCQDNA